MRILPALLCVVVCALPQSASAARSFDNCSGFITSLPAVITTQGVWCLDRDLSTSLASGNVITIETNNVILDCNDFKLGGLAAGPSTLATGIRAQSRLNATIRNCNLRGFLIGMQLSGGGHVVEDNRLDGNRFLGIQVTGAGSVIRRNIVADTGGSTVVSAATGMVVGNSSLVSENLVSVIAPDPEGDGAAQGILVVGDYSSIRNNLVRGVLGSLTGETPKGIAITGLGNDVSDNRIFASGVDSGQAIFCATAASATVSRNVLINNNLAWLNCSDGGGNIVN